MSSDKSVNPENASMEEHPNQNINEDKLQYPFDISISSNKKGLNSIINFSKDDNDASENDSDSEEVHNDSRDDSSSSLPNFDEDKESYPVSSSESCEPNETDVKETPPPLPDDISEQHEKKPAIYSNRWRIPVDDSFKFDSDPLMSYENIQSFIKAHHKELEEWLENLIGNNEMLPMPFRPTSPEHKTDKFIRVAPEDIEGKEVWFIGDVHGDFLSLTASLKSINFDVCSSTFYSNKKIIVLLGDVFDRIDDSFETFFTVLWLMYKFHNIVWLSGNHDFVTYKEASDSFYSPTSPSDYTQWLNDPEAAEDEMHPIARQITKLYSRLIDTLPAGLYFPDGLFVSHGGFPHPHWYDSIRKWGDFNNSDFVYDFFWKRVHETKPRAAFSNSSKSGQLGIEDFESFCHQLNDRFKSPVSAYLRGHDHYPERVKVFDAYKIPVITINTMSCAKDGCDPIGKFGYQTTPVIIKYQPTIPDDYVSCAELDSLEPKCDITTDNKTELGSAEESCSKSDPERIDSESTDCQKEDVLQPETESTERVLNKPESEISTESKADVDFENQDSAIPTNNNYTKALTVPDIVIYRLDITRDLLNKWYPNK